MQDISAVRTEEAPAPLAGAPYSQAVRSGDLVLVSGQIGLDPQTGTMVEGGVAEQTERVLLNLAAILRGAGSTLQHVLKATVYLADLEDWPAMNEVYARHVGDPPPARTAFQVAGLPAGALVEIDVIATAAAGTAPDLTHRTKEDR